MERFRYFHVEDPVYHHSIHIAAGGSHSQAAKKYDSIFIGKSNNYEALPVFESAVTMTLWGDEGNVYEQFIWVVRRSDIVAVVHELMHATFNVMESIGVRNYKEEPEPFTYYQGYLMEQYIKHIGLGGT